MSAYYSKRYRIRQILRSSVSALIVLYFTFHAVQGDRGLFSLMRLQRDVRLAEQQYAELKTEREGLEQKVNLLHPDHLDKDMLDEQVRKSLKLVHKDEVVIYLN